MRFLLDQGLPRSLKHILNQIGHETEHVSYIGMSSSSDEEIINYARKNDYICITLDADFHSILVLSSEKSPSVIRIRIEGLKADDYRNLLLNILPSIETSLKQGCLVSIQEDTVRVRILPVER